MPNVYFPRECSETGPLGNRRFGWYQRQTPCGVSTYPMQYNLDRASDAPHGIADVYGMLEVHLPQGWSTTIGIKAAGREFIKYLFDVSEPLLRIHSVAYLDVARVGMVSRACTAHFGYLGGTPFQPIHTQKPSRDSDLLDGGLWNSTTLKLGSSFCFLNLIVSGCMKCLILKDASERRTTETCTMTELTQARRPSSSRHCPPCGGDAS